MTADYCGERSGRLVEMLRRGRCERLREVALFAWRNWQNGRFAKLEHRMRGAGPEASQHPATHCQQGDDGGRDRQTSQLPLNLSFLADGVQRERGRGCDRFPPL